MKTKLSIWKMVFMFLFIILFNTNSVFAEISYDSEILKQFDEQGLVRVIVRLTNDSNLNVIDSTAERNILNQNDNWFRPHIINVLSTFSEREFKLSREFSNGFAGIITKEGFNKLVDNPRISQIYLDTVGSISLDNSVEIINANDVWSSSYTGSGVDICIIDSGVKASHPDLTGKIINEYCFCAITNLGGGGCCPDNTNEDIDAEDDNGHGTHVTGIVASQNSTYRGVSYGANIYVVKVTNSSGNYLTSDLGSAIDKCKLWGVDIVSMSLGDNQNHPGISSCPTAIDTEINNAYNANISIIAASGNNAFINGISYPACSPNAISVGATYDYSGGYEGSCSDLAAIDKITCFSNRANILDLLAPGAIITSLSSSGPSGCADGVCSGTSQATPHVAGAAALLQDAYNGNLTPQKILLALNTSGKPIFDGASGWLSGKYFFPRIDIKRALEYLPWLDTLHTDWPTENHDFRRTGFTLLKGDMPNASAVEKMSFVLKSGFDSPEQVVKATVADLDNNDAMDTVTLVHKITANNETEIHAVEIEKKKNLLSKGYKSVTTKKWSTTAKGGASYFPATLANIDSDPQKEVIMGVRNGTVYAYDVSSNGKSVSQRWAYYLPQKWSPLASLYVTRFNGGTAVVDIDLDGNNEIVFADVFESDPNWPGEVYVLKDNGAGSTPTKWANKTFGNGGAYATVSIANIDNDDNPEIIVPSLYGIYVFDYNTSAQGKLSTKWSNSDGKIESSAISINVYKGDAL